MQGLWAGLDPVVLKLQEVPQEWIHITPLPTPKPWLFQGLATLTKQLSWVGTAPVPWQGLALL